MTATRLLLVRHGESTWNASRRWQGRADPPLSDRGEQQAIQAGRRVVEHGPFDAVVTSTLRRARRTGELLAVGLRKELGPAHEPLAERSAGEWEGLTRAEIEERYPGFLTDGRRPLGYEPDADVVARSTATLAAIARSDLGGPATRTSQGRSGRLIVVTHGGVINALERFVEEEWRRLDNLEGRWFEVDDASGRVLPIGDRVHLLGTADPNVPAHDAASGPGYA